MIVTSIAGFTPTIMAAVNGHMKCERRIWLFNWNIDVLNETESPTNEPDDIEQVVHEFYEKYNK